MTEAVRNASSDSTAAAAMRGDAMALQDLWQEHRRWIAAVLLAYKPRHEDLEDLLQEVAMTLVSKITTIRDETNIRAWLRAVAINAARASARSAKSRPRPALGTIDGEPWDAVAPAVDARSHSGTGVLDDEAQRVVEMATQLPENYREPLILKAVHGMRSRQISLILGIPEATVDTRVSRARKMLRELLHGPAEPSLAGASVAMNGAMIDQEHSS